MTNMQTNTTAATAEVEQKASEISARIQALTDFDGESLKNEMGALKKALLENPAACLLLHDEDVGAAVTALRRMTGIAAASAAAPAKKLKQKALSPAELAKALAEVPDDEFL